MKILKVAGITVLAFMASFLIVAFFLPKTSRVERSLVIKKPAKEVFRVVQDFKYYKEWNPWMSMDPTSKVNLSTPSNQVGSYWEWEGQKIGSGKQTTTRLIENVEIESSLEFLKPMKGLAKATFFFEPEGADTKVRWVYEGESNYPLGRYFGLMMDSFLGPAFETGLKKLAEFVEKH